jgi:signal peptidase I
MRDTMPETYEPFEAYRRPSQLRRFLRSTAEFLTFAAVAAAILIPFRMFIAKPFVVEGASMSPTFETGDYLIVDEISLTLRPPERGEVVVLCYPHDPAKHFIKRIVGLPGEKISVEDGAVTVTPKGGQPITLDEPYVERESKTTASATLGPNEYFVMGDNRAGSYDSRVWGPVPRDLIVGRALLRLLPVSEIGALPGDARETLAD